MGFQKCPVCNGTRKEINTLSNCTHVMCKICKGTGLINEWTGLPPSNTDDINSGINGEGETQQEYLGK